MLPEGPGYMNVSVHVATPTKSSIYRWIFHEINISINPSSNDHHSWKPKKIPSNFTLPRQIMTHVSPCFPTVHPLPRHEPGRGAWQSWTMHPLQRPGPMQSPGSVLTTLRYRTKKRLPEICLAPFSTVDDLHVFRYILI